MEGEGWRTGALVQKTVIAARAKTAFVQLLQTKHQTERIKHIKLFKVVDCAAELETILTNPA